MLKAKTSPWPDGLHVVRYEQCVRSRHHRGVLVRVIHECDAMEILRTEMEAGSCLDYLDIGDSTAFHFVIDGSPVVRASSQSADLMPGESVVFNRATPYTISNCAPTRSVILSVLFKTPEKDGGA